MAFWSFVILCDLAGMGVRDNLLTVIQSCLLNCTFRVRIGNVLSHPFMQETGVPQGGVLSCALFVLKMNSLHTAIPRTRFYSVYVDDVQIVCKSSNLAICEQQVQLGLNKLCSYATWTESGYISQLLFPSCYYLGFATRLLCIEALVP